MGQRGVALAEVEQRDAELALHFGFARRIGGDLELEAEQRRDHLEIPHLSIDRARTLQGSRIRRRQLERRLVVNHRAVLAQEEILAKLAKLEQALRFDFLRLDLLDFPLELLDQSRPTTRRPQPLFDLLAEFHVALSSHTHRGIRRNKAASVIT